MNHRIILGISWCIEAILIYVSFELDGYLYKIVYGNYNGKYMCVRISMPKMGKVRQIYCEINKMWLF